MRKKVYVVLGMSRTGTSAIARSLIALGIDLGSRFIPGNNLNPKGFWEDKDIMHKINRGVSAAIDLKYMYMDTVSDNDIITSPILNAYRTNAVKLLESRLQSTDYWGFKDPRTVTIMPFWHSVFKTLDVDDKYIIVVRNPLAAAHSNQKFINCDLEEAMLIWLYQLYAAIDGTQGKKRVVVSYENMLQNPRLQLQRMHEALEIPVSLDEQAVNAYAEEFLDKDLRHHVYSDDDFLNSPITRVAPLSMKLYALLKQLANDELSFNEEKFSLIFQEIRNEYKKLQPLHCYVDSLLKRNKQYAREMKNINKSLIWKMMYPLRLVDDILRERRRKRKIQHRLKPVYE